MISDIKAVFCSRGGYGISRIISKVDFSAVKENPKWYVGFSDITVLHMWLSEVCGIISVHGEMPLNFNNTERPAYTFDLLNQHYLVIFSHVSGKALSYKSCNVSR